MKVSSPLVMQSGENELSEVIYKFEKQLSTEDKGQKRYHLVIEGEYDREICNQVEELYSNNGWKNVSCSTSSETGERAGLTCLVLCI